MTPNGSFTEKLPILEGRPLLQYGFALLFCFGALVLRSAVDPALPPGYPFLTFFPAVILSAFLFGLRPGILAAALCGILAFYFFVEPRNSFGVSRNAFVAMSFYFGVVAVDVALVHWMQLANARLNREREKVRQLAEERGRLAERNEALFREVQHRVGNNLQMVGSILSLQLRGLSNPEARRAIGEAVSRLEVIGSIQRQLYVEDGAPLALDTFLMELADQSMRSGGRPGIECNVQAEGGLALGPESALPLALVVSEAIANALEHGLADRDEGRIAIDLRRDGQNVVLSIRDDGNGLPPGFDSSASSSLGLRLSQIFSRQLDADYSLANGPIGTVMRLILPAHKFASA